MSSIKPRLRPYQLADLEKIDAAFAADTDEGRADLDRFRRIRTAFSGDKS